ncbi:MAG TPA: hypothetical protein VFD83_01355 [Candidatus Polarisedimenticolia bacterium]|nr:hypothetical protein [Candidatus Polarisedimenticolia bacterium]
MEAKNLTFPGALILGAGLMYLFDPDRGKTKNPSPSLASGLQCFAGVLGVAAVAYGAGLFARRGHDDPSTSTAFDLDVPNYAWLR